MRDPTSVPQKTLTVVQSVLFSIFEVTFKLRFSLDDIPTNFFSIFRFKETMRLLTTLSFLLLTWQLSLADEQCSVEDLDKNDTKDKQVKCSGTSYVAGLRNGFFPAQVYGAKCCKTEEALSDCIER